IAICAMILLGISGSFILVILGAYKTLSDAIHDWDLKRIAIFGVGAVVGLLNFSRVLKWLFKHHHNTTLALLAGFIVGSLNKIWSRNKVNYVVIDTIGQTVPSVHNSILGSLSVYQQQVHEFEADKVVTDACVARFVYSGIINSVSSQLFAARSLVVGRLLTLCI